MWCNKVIWYMVTRYVTYAVQFIVSILVAAKLGPFQLGIWGFVLLLINYFHIFNFGIPNSTTVLMVKNKNDQDKAWQIETSSMVLMGIIGLVIILIAVYYALFGIPLFDKYQIGNLFYLVCVIAIMQHFVSLFSLIARVRGSIVEVAFAQSVIPVLTLIAVICFRDRILLLFLVLSYVIGNALAIFLFIKKKLVLFYGRPSQQACKDIVNKGKYLFVYNVCFYLIFLSTKTIVSKYYPVEEFGYFTFAYTLSNAVLLMMQAFTAIVFPKLIDKLGQPDFRKVDLLLQEVRVNYVTMSHGLMYLAIILFPVLIMFMPKYHDALPIINLMALTLLLYANSFGYSTLLIAQNRERKLAMISLISLLLNVGLAFLLIKIGISYKYVIVATMSAYFVYSFLCVFIGQPIIREKVTFRSIITECFPFRLLVPYLLYALASFLTLPFYIYIISFLIFVFLNYKSLKSIISSIGRIFRNPNVVDV